MSKITKIIGWLVLAITEIMMIVTFFTNPELRGTLIASQVVVFGAVWGSVAWKNQIDYKWEKMKYEGINK